MDKLYFNEEHLMLRDMVREFAINEVRPLSAKIDKESIFPQENIKKNDELNHVDSLDFFLNDDEINKKN